MSDSSGTIEFGGTTLRCWTHGADGLPWLVISHGLGLDSTSFEPLAARLKPRWRVLRWDLPGHGESGPMPAAFDMTMSVKALETVLTAAGCDRAVLLGFSYGGVVSQLLAYKRPTVISGLIAYGCFSPLLIKGPPVWTKRLAEKMVMRGSWQSVRERFARSCSIREDVRSQIVDAVTRVGAAAFRKIVRALLGVNAYDPTFRIRGPVMWIAGARDSNLTALNQVETALRASHPHLVAEIVPDAGHCAHQDNPQKFEATVEKFLESSFSGLVTRAESVNRSAN
jgi:3-oxoadipate enol-lactonase